MLQDPFLLDLPLPHPKPPDVSSLYHTHELSLNGAHTSFKQREQQQPPVRPRQRPPAIQFPGIGTRQDIVKEDINRIKEVLLEHNLNINDVQDFL